MAESKAVKRPSSPLSLLKKYINLHITLFPGIPAAIYYSPAENEFSRMPTSVSVTVISRWVLFVSGITCPGCVIWIQCLLINKPSV